MNVCGMVAAARLITTTERIEWSGLSSEKPGPHLVVVVLYAAGNVPVSALVASSVVQDGHGMLSLLAHSWRDFIKVKPMNLVVGLLVGGALMAAGW